MVRDVYQPRFAHPTPELEKLLVFRSVNPLYGAFLVKHLGIADRDERVQALESVLEVPTSILRDVRVPRMRDLPPGLLATTRLDALLMGRGLVTAEQLRDKSDDEGLSWEERWTPTLADKLRMLFDSEFPAVHDLVTRPVWIAGEALRLRRGFQQADHVEGDRPPGRDHLSPPFAFHPVVRRVLTDYTTGRRTGRLACRPRAIWPIRSRIAAGPSIPKAPIKPSRRRRKAPDVVRGEKEASPEPPPAIEEDPEDFGVGLEV